MCSVISMKARLCFLSARIKIVCVVYLRAYSTAHGEASDDHFAR